MNVCKVVEMIYGEAGKYWVPACAGMATASEHRRVVAASDAVHIHTTSAPIHTTSASLYATPAKAGVQSVAPGQWK